ncbi:hypothetical protein SFRURICE_003175 [Spodoptera frugiperda]|nr:hypothetical protein SFRURICE_003175 [Spodoptera frugiperda]
MSKRYVAMDAFRFHYLIIFIGTQSLVPVKTDSVKLCFLYGKICAIDRFPTIDTSHNRAAKRSQFHSLAITSS